MNFLRLLRHAFLYSNHLPIFAAASGFVLMSPCAQAESFDWNRPFESISKLHKPHEFLGDYRISLDPDQDKNPLNLYRGGLVSLQDAVGRLLRERSLHPLVEIRATSSTRGLSLTTGTTSEDYRFYVQGTPICGYQVRAHSLADRTTLVLGRMPGIDVLQPVADGNWPALDLAVDLAFAAVEEHTGVGESSKLIKKSRCLQVVAGEVIPVWNLTLVHDGLPYHVRTDEYEVFDLQRGYFDVTGTSRVYEFNETDGSLKDFELRNLIGNGTLTSTYLRTKVAEGWAKAFNEDHLFIYDPNDQRFDEVSAFTHALQHLKFFENWGFQWYGPKPLEIQVHFRPRGQINNALFIPAEGTVSGIPTISIGDGDGRELQSLPRDGDVVSHEFGHFVIYQTLKRTDGESLVLHEGLADFFAFARTGNSCLGESICATTSTSCWERAKCLRTADPDLKYGDELWHQLAQVSASQYKLGHYHGQLVSGMLWDLRRNGAIPADDLTQLVLKSVDFFVENSGFRDFMLSLLHADKELFGSKYQSSIMAAGEHRGLLEFFEDVKPGGAIPDLEGSSNSLQTSEKKDDKKEKSRSKSSKKPSLFSCGTIQIDHPSTMNMFLLLAFMSMPLLVAAPRKARARITGKKRLK